MMNKTNKQLCIKDSIVNALQNKGINAKYQTDGKQEQIDCYIDGTSFAFFYDLEQSTLSYGIIFEPNDIVDDEQYDRIAMLFANEETPFDDCMMDEFGCIHLYGEICSDSFDQEFVDSIVNSVANQDGVIAELKNISYIWEEN